MLLSSFPLSDHLDQLSSSLHRKSLLCNNNRQPLDLSVRSPSLCSFVHQLQLQLIEFLRKRLPVWYTKPVGGLLCSPNSSFTSKTKKWCKQSTGDDFDPLILISIFFKFCFSYYYVRGSHQITRTSVGFCTSGLWYVRALHPT